MLLALPTDAQWDADWGFSKAGGLPPMPVELQSYALNRSVVAYFVGNNTGLASPAELSAETTPGIL